MPRPADTGSGRKRKVARRKAGAAEVERAAEQIQAFVKRPVRIRKQPKVKPVKKAVAVTVARSGERNSRKLPVAKPKSKRERDAMLIAASNRDTKVRNRTAGEAVRALNERSTKRVALSDPKRAQRIVVKDAMRGLMADTDRGLRESLAGTPVKGKARKKAIEDLTSGKQARVKKVGPFTRSQLEREGAVRRYRTGEQLPSPLRKTRYKKPATTPIGKAIEAGGSRADANALKLLDLAARPFYATAAAATAAAKGEDVGKAAKRGITGKEKASYRNALRELGLPKAAADVLGTVGDFTLDPVNAVSFGAASTARSAGAKAARAAAKKGASEAVIRKARLEAMRAVEDLGKAKVGVRVRVAGKSVDVPLRRVDAVKERELLARRKVSARNAARGVNPRVRPKGVRESDFELLRESATDARAFRDEALNRSRRVSRSASKNVKRKDTPDVLEGVERQDFTKLSGDRVTVAGRLDAHEKKQLAARKDAGLRAEVGGKVEVTIPKMTADVGAATRRVKAAERVLVSRKSQATRVDRQAAVRELKAAQRNLKKVRKQAAGQETARRAAVKTAARYDGMAEGYVPHLRRKDLQEGAKPSVQGGSAFSKTVTDHSRKDLRPLSEKNKARVGLDRFEDEDLGLLLAAQGSRDANRVAKARFNKRIAEDAPRYKHGAPLRDGEGVYYFDDGDLRRLTDDDLEQVAKGKHKDKHLVRLDDAAYDRFVDDLKPLDRTGTGELIDRAQASWKRLALATPGFYTRNLIGEAAMGYMGTQGARQTLRYTKAGLPGGKAGRTLKRVRQREMDELDYFNPKRTVGKQGDKIKVAGKDMDLDDFIDEATADGVLRKGQQGNELRELQDALGDQSSIVRDSKRRVTKAVPVRSREKAHSFAADIEDRWRLASYMAYRDSGMTRQEARRRALDFHFDYGELSRTERQLRRVLPFYTFNARALEMYARSAITRPGKLSGIEKARNTVADVTGADPDWMEGAKEYQRRQVPVVARIGGEDLMLQAGLPVGLLNEFPVSALEGLGKLATGDVAGAASAAKSQADEWFLFTMGLVTPFVKAPVEIGQNRSFFFRSDIEAKGRRLVAAPEYLKPLVGTDVGDLLGLVDDYKDKRSGKTVLGYRAKADYLIRQIPGIPAILNRLASKGTNRRDQSQTQEIIAAVTGVNPDPVDKTEASFERLYDERDRIDAQMGDLRQRGKDESAEYERLKRKKKELDAQIGTAKIERGDADSKPKTKRKVRKSSGGSRPGSLWGGGGSSPSSSSGSMWGGSSSPSSGSSSMWGK